MHAQQQKQQRGGGRGDAPPPQVTSVGPRRGGPQQHRGRGMPGGGRGMGGGGPMNTRPQVRVYMYNMSIPARPIFCPVKVASIILKNALVFTARMLLFMAEVTKSLRHIVICLIVVGGNDIFNWFF